MDSKIRGTALQTLLSYNDFEPPCTWQREETHDVLVIHVPEFKKEQLRVQISNSGLLKISGDKVIEGEKRKRFLKEVNVTKEYDSDNIHAKFSQGCLRITLPKKVPTPPSTSVATPAVVTSSPKDRQSNNVTTNEKSVTPDTNEKTSIRDIKASVSRVLKSKTFTRVMVTVGFASVAAFSVYTAYKYWLRTSDLRVNKD